MAIFSNFITTRAGSPNNEISTGDLFISASSITSSAAEGRDELVSNAGSSTNYRLSAFTTIDTRLPLVAPYSSTPFGMTTNWGATQTAWNLVTATTDPSSAPIYWPPMLTIKGNPDSSGVYPFPSTRATFAPNVALLVSGGLHVYNDIRGFNRLEGITHIPGNNALVIGGKLNATAAQALYQHTFNNTLTSSIDPSSPFRNIWSNKLSNNLTIFGGGMGQEGTLSGQSYRYQQARGFLGNFENGSGINMYGYDPNDRGFRLSYVYGLRFAMENLYLDPDGSRYGRSFVMRIANPHLSTVEQSLANYQQATIFSAQASILQYSFWQNTLTLGTYEKSNYGGSAGKTQLVSGHQLELLSNLQITQYQPEPNTVSGSILYVAFKHRFAGSNTAGQESQVYFDNVELYATSSVLPNFGTDYQYALTVRSGSGLYTGNPNVWHIGLGIVSASGGGGGASASLFPGGDNYDIQYNVTRGGNPPRFGGANEINKTFEYVYDATPDALFRFDGRMQQGTSTFATALASIATGVETLASANYAHAEGRRTTASGQYSHAEGDFSIASAAGSHAEGYNTQASANWSHAEGDSTQASGQYSHAEGHQTNTSEQHSHAEGYATSGSGRYAHAEGYETNASGLGSHAEGYQTVATGSYSHAEGIFTSGSGVASHAEGEYSRAIGAAAHAEGYNTRAVGNNSHAEGYQTNASGPYSHAEGIGTVASVSGQHAEGRYNLPSATALWILGDGETAINRHNLIEGHTGSVRFSGSLFVQPGQGYLPSAVQSTVLTYDPSTGQIQLMNTSSFSGGGGGGGPQYWIQNGSTLFTSGGFQNVQVTGSLYASGSEHTFVGTTTVSGGLFIQPPFVPTTVVTSGGTNPMILAYNTVTGQVQKTTLTAVGATPAPPSWSIQFNRNGNFGGSQFFLYSESVNTVFAATQLNIGLRNRVNQNTYGVVMGSQSFAQGIGSFAQGFQVTASGNYSHAQGTGSRASGLYSHAEGIQTLASGRHAHAEGYLTLAADDYSHAEGQETQAKGNASHAEGFKTLTNGIAAHAEGREATASGNYSHAEGYLTRALGEYAHAEGTSTIASGSGAHAEGNGTQALGNGAHAEGWDSVATGRYSHAEGRLNLASGLASTARGRQSTASGDYSQASGFRVEALAPYQQVFGQYNVPSIDTGSLFIIGAGFNGQDKNALVITTASMTFSSSLYFADGADYTSGQRFLPRASQSLMFVYNQATGQVQLMHTSSIAGGAAQPQYWIQNGSTLFTSGGFQSVQVTGSLFVSASSAPYTIAYDLPSVRRSIDPGVHKIVGALNLSSSYADTPALTITQFNSRARALDIEGGVGVSITSISGSNDISAPQGTLFGGLGIGGFPRATALNILSASSFQGMRRDTVTKTGNNGYQIHTGSNNTMHIAPGVGSDITINFPGMPGYGTTFTLIIDTPGTTTIETGSRDTGEPTLKIQSPSSTTFAGAVYGNSFSNVPVGVYNYMYLNVSSGSIGNAWVLTSKM